MRKTTVAVALALLMSGAAFADDDYDPRATPPGLNPPIVRPPTPVRPPTAVLPPTAIQPTVPVVPTPAVPQPVPYVVPTQPVPYVGPTELLPYQPSPYVAPYGQIPAPPPPPDGLVTPYVVPTQPIPRVEAPAGTYQPPAIAQPPVVPYASPAPPTPVVRSTSSVRLVLEGTYTIREDVEGPVGVPANGAADMMWNPVELGGALGGRAALVFGARHDTRWEIKGGYFGEWDDTAQTTGLFATGTPPASLGPLSAEARVQSRLFGGELNWRPALQCQRDGRLDAIVGLRILVLEEQASVRGFTPPLLAALGGGAAQGETDNTLIAFQAGVGYEKDLGSAFTFYGDFRAFFGLNSADAATQATDLFAAGTATNSTSDDLFAWGVNLDLGFRVCLGSNFYLSAGYSLLFVDGLAEIESAMDFSNVANGAPLARVDETGLLFHTFFAGVTLDL